MVRTSGNSDGRGDEHRTDEVVECCSIRSFELHNRHNRKKQRFLSTRLVPGKQPEQLSKSSSSWWWRLGNQCCSSRWRKTSSWVLESSSKSWSAVGSSCYVDVELGGEVCSKDRQWRRIHKSWFRKSW